MGIRLHVRLLSSFALTSILIALAGPSPSAMAHDGHGLQPRVAATEAPLDRPPEGAKGITLETVEPDWWRGDDMLVTGRGDSGGYTVHVALEREKYAVRPLATIKPAGYDGDDWLGYTCLTGDRRYAAVTLLPRWAVNKTMLRDRGALAYAVSIQSGRVWPLTNGVAFKYHAMNCGSGSKVAFVRHWGNDQQSSEVLLADAATRRVATLGVVRGQVTSPVPSGAGAIALGRGGLLTLRAGGRVSVLTSAPPGLPYRVVARGSGQALAVLRGETVTVYAVQSAALSQVASGPKKYAGIYASASPRPIVVGMQARTKRVVDPQTVVLPRLTKEEGRDAGNLVPDAVSAEGKVVLATLPATPGTTSNHRDADPSATLSVPSAAEKRLFSARSGRLLEGTFPDERAASTTGAIPTTTTAAKRLRVTANFTTPKCGVPRNEPGRMAYGAGHNQASWAVEQASRNSLPTRPADYLKTGLPSYNPSSDFAVPVLKPNGGRVPPALFNGVMAQESAYRQASRRSLPGSGGNSVISDYYGAGGTVDVIDYNNADCGYGISQVTSGMATSETSITPNGKAKVAVDYAENIQAGMNILAKKWNQLYDAGTRINSSDPSKIESWYGALWAYNSGVQPDARFGNTTGCTPSPSCTDAYGNWGLGWTNNPRNTDYPPTRSVFLRETYADAEHPADWPYQERVIGWAETPIRNYKGQPAYPAAARGTALPYPNINAFCNASNSCDPATVEGCTRADWRCWWHEPLTFKNCEPPAGACSTSEFTTSAGAPEPTAPNPWAPACNSDLGPQAIIVDNLSDPSKNIFCPNRNWTNRGTFTYVVGKDAAGAPLGVIDFHQLATGFGGHTYFAGNRLISDVSHRVVGTWTPTNLPAGPYVIRVHVPRAGASVGSAIYKVTTANGTVREKVVNQHEHFNHWKSLGAFQLGSNAKVELDNVTRTDTAANTGTVAWDAIAFVPAPGTYQEHTVGAYAYFDGDQHVAADLTTSWLGGPLGGPDQAYDWAAPLSARLVSEGGPAVKAAAQRWKHEVEAAKVSPDVDDDGISPASWLGLSNPHTQRPASASLPSWFETDDSSYKIRSKATVSFVKGADGLIIPGSEDVDYTHRTGDTHLPKFITDLFVAIDSDYGVPHPNLSYSTVNLREYDHQVRSVASRTLTLPGRAYKPAGQAAALIKGQVDGQQIDCVRALGVSGGGIGYRPMLGVGYLSARVDAWAIYVSELPGIPSSVKDIAKDIHRWWFSDRGPYGALGSPFNQAPGIWQELHFSVCANGKVYKSGFTEWRGPVLRVSWMPDNYLYHNGTAIDLEGRASSHGRVYWGEFQPFSRAPVPHADDSNGDCEFEDGDGRNGNPWGISAGLQPAGINPSTVHFCYDPDLSVDPDESG
jgi:hypothetical protein